MNQDQVLQILNDVGAQNVRPYASSGNIQFSCLHAPFKHEGGSDGTPSASVSYKHEVSLVNCFACEFGGTFVQYIGMYNQYMNGSVSGVVDAAKYFEKGDPASKIDAVLKKYEQKFAYNNEVTNKLEVWNEEELSAFQKIVKPSFLRAKRISLEVAQDFCLMWEERHQMVVAPIRRYDGGLVGCTGRCWCDQCKGGAHHAKRYYNYWNFPSGKFLFNEWLVDRSQPVIVVEGIFDVLRMASAGYDNTVALMGSSLSDTQAKKLKSLTQPVYMMLDGDMAGRKGVMKAVGMLRGTVVSLRECEVPDGKDPGDLSDGELKNIVESARLVL